MLLFPPACTTVAPGKYVVRHPSCDSRRQKSASSQVQEETFVHAAGLFEGAPAHQHTRPGDPVDVKRLLTGIECWQIQPGQRITREPSGQPGAAARDDGRHARKPTRRSLHGPVGVENARPRDGDVDTRNEESQQSIACRRSDHTIGVQEQQKGRAPQARPEIDAGRESFVSGSFNQLDPREALSQAGGRGHIGFVVDDEHLFEPRSLGFERLEAASQLVVALVIDDKNVSKDVGWILHRQKS